MGIEGAGDAHQNPAGKIWDRRQPHGTPVALLLVAADERT